MHYTQWCVKRLSTSCVISVYLIFCNKQISERKANFLSENTNCTSWRAMKFSCGNSFVGLQKREVSKVCQFRSLGRVGLFWPPYCSSGKIVEEKRTFYIVRPLSE